MPLKAYKEIFALVGRSNYNSIRVPHHRNGHQVLMSDVLPSPENRDVEIQSPLVRFSNFLKSVYENWATRAAEKREELNVWREYHKAVRRYRMEQLRKRSLFTYIKEQVFVMLDYDATDVVSGEEELPTIRSALYQWWIRVFWTRRVELVGMLVLGIVGYYCYQAIVVSKEVERQVQTITSTDTVAPSNLVSGKQRMGH